MSVCFCLSISANFFWLINLFIYIYTYLKINKIGKYDCIKCFLLILIFRVATKKRKNLLKMKKREKQAIKKFSGALKRG